MSDFPKATQIVGEPGIQLVNLSVPLPYQWRLNPLTGSSWDELALNLSCLEKGAVTGFIPEGSPYENRYTML